MLAVTDRAASVIRQLMTSNGGDAPGVRVAATPSGDAIQLSVVSAPQPGDSVVDAEGGAQVFVDQNAMLALDDKALDVDTDEGGRVEFTITTRPL